MNTQDFRRANLEGYKRRLIAEMEQILSSLSSGLNSKENITLKSLQSLIQLGSTNLQHYSSWMCLRQLPLTVLLGREET
jgi:hypothetical protein